MSTNASDTARALRHVIDEVKSCEPPALDWEGIERRTLAAIDAGQTRAAAGRSFGALAFAVAAAALVLLVAGQRGPSLGALRPTSDEFTIDVASLPVLVQGPDARPAYLASAIPSSAVVEATSEPLSFVVPEVARWVAEPGTRFFVEHTGLPNVLRLDRGAIHAEVVPRHDRDALVEALVIEAGGTRVAAHGTVFSVERSADRVVVEVTEGVVSIGPAGYHGATTGLLLAGPARAAFSAASGELMLLRDAPADEQTDRIASAAPAASATAQKPSAASLQASASGAESSPPAESPAESAQARRDKAEAQSDKAEASLVRSPRPEASSSASASPKAPPPLSVDEARAVMVACLAAGAGLDGGGDTQVTVTTTVTALLDGDRKVSTLRFDPPLRPDLERRCGAALFGRALDASGSASFRIHFGISGSQNK